MTSERQKKRERERATREYSSQQRTKAIMCFLNMHTIEHNQYRQHNRADRRDVVK